jgi:hypothetical protein
MNIYANGRASKQVIVPQNVPKMTSLLRKTQLTTELPMDKHETAFILDMCSHGARVHSHHSHPFSSLLIPSLVPSPYASPHPFSSSLLLIPSPRPFSSSLLLIPSPHPFSSSLLLVPSPHPFSSSLLLVPSPLPFS